MEDRMFHGLKYAAKNIIVVHSDFFTGHCFQRCCWKQCPFL